MKNAYLLKDIYKSLVTPSIVSIAVATFLCIAVVLTVFFGLSPAFMMSPAHAYLATDSFDDHVFVYSRAEQLAHSNAKTKKLILFGASSLRASLNEDAFKLFITREIDTPVEIYNFSASAQTLWESISLADKLPDGSEGVVVLSLGPGRFSYNKSVLSTLLTQSNLAFTGASFDEELSRAGLKVPTRSGNYFWDNRIFFLSRYYAFISNIIIGPPVQGHGYVGRAPISADRLSRNVRNRERHLSRLQDNLEVHLGVLSRFVNLIKSRTSMSIIFLEEPVNPRFDSALLSSTISQKYLSAIKGLAQANGAVYENINEKSELEPADFYDVMHMRDEKKIDLYSENLAFLVMQYL